MALALSHFRGGGPNIYVFGDQIARLTVTKFSKKSEIDAFVEFLFSRLNQDGEVTQKKDYSLQGLSAVMEPFLDAELFPEKEYKKYRLRIYLGFQDMKYKKNIKLCYDASGEIEIIRPEAKKKYKFRSRHGKEI